MKINWKNPFVWFGIVIAVLGVLRLALPERYVKDLPAMLTAEGRCAIAKEVLNNPRDSAAFCPAGTGKQAP